MAYRMPPQVGARSGASAFLSAGRMSRADHPRSGVVAGSDLCQAIGYRQTELRGVAPEQADKAFGEHHGHSLALSGLAWPSARRGLALCSTHGEPFSCV